MTRAFKFVGFLDKAKMIEIKRISIKNYRNKKEIVAKNIFVLSAIFSIELEAIKQKSI